MPAPALLFRNFRDGARRLLPSHPAEFLSSKELWAWALCLAATATALSFLGAYLYMSVGFGPPVGPRRHALIPLACIGALVLLVGGLIAAAPRLRRSATITGLIIVATLFACSIYASPIELHRLAINDGSPAPNLQDAVLTREWGSHHYAFPLHPWHDAERPVQTVRIAIPYGVSSVEFLLTKPEDSILGPDGKPNEGDGVLIDFTRVAGDGGKSPLDQIALSNQTANTDHWISHTIPVTGKMAAIDVRVLSNGTTYFDSTLIAVRPHGILPFLAGAGQRSVVLPLIVILAGLVLAFREWMYRGQATPDLLRRVFEAMKSICARSNQTPRLVPVQDFKVLFFFAVVVVIVYMAVVFLPYAFSDDFVYLPGNAAGQAKEFIMPDVRDGRPLLALWLFVTFPLIGSIGDVGFLRGVGLLGIILFAYLLHRALVRERLPAPVTLLVPLIVVTMPPFQVYAAWAICSGFPFAAIIAGLAFRAAQFAEKSSSPAWIAVSILALTTSLAWYQPAAMVFWLFTATAWLSRSRRLGFRSLAIPGFVMGAAVALWYLVVLKGLPAFLYGDVGTPERAHLVPDWFGKAQWFVAVPMRDALNTLLIEPSNALALAMSAFLLTGLCFNWTGTVVQRAFRLSLAIALLPAAYLPNLATAEDWASYRTQVGLTSLVVLYAALALLGWLRVLRANKLLTPLLGFAVIGSGVAASYNATMNFAWPNALEWRILTHALSSPDMASAEHVLYVPAGWGNSLTSTVRYDEYGTNSASKPWAPTPMIKSALLELYGPQLNVPISKLPQTGAALPANHYIVDFPRLYDSFRLDPIDWKRNAANDSEPTVVRKDQQDSTAAEKSDAAAGKEEEADGNRVKEDYLITGLILLKATTIPVNRIAPSLKVGGGTIVAVQNRILLADGIGQFFEVDLSEQAPAARALPLRIDLHERELLEYAAGRGRVDFYLLRVHKLAVLQRQSQLAVSYSLWDTKRKCVSLAVAVMDLPADWGAMSPDNWRVVFESQPCLELDLEGSLLDGHQAGGRIVETSPGIVALTVGDFGFDGNDRKPGYPQNPNADYGKIVEIDTATGKHKQLTVGHRNPQGLVHDQNGQLWSTEHGPRGGDELNLIVAGSNYGWPAETLGTQYGTYAWPLSSRQGRHENFEQPKFAWLPSIGAGNLIQVRNFAEEWNGDLLVASLHGTLRRLRMNGDAAVYDEPIEIGERLRDIDQLADGRIVLWTDSGELTTLEAATDEKGVSLRIENLPDEVRSAVSTCIQCHSIEGSDGDPTRISLWNIYGRAIASGPPGLYSDSLKTLDGQWDAEELDRWLKDPKEMAPGTTMSFSGIQDDAIRRQVIDFLETLQ